MIIGQTMLKGATTYSPWFPRQGDAATFGVEVIGRSTNGTITVTIQHRNMDTIESGATTEVTTISSSSTGVTRGRYTGLKELVRFQFDVTGTVAMDWVHFRMVAPAWERNANGAMPAMPM